MLLIIEENDDDNDDNDDNDNDEDNESEEMILLLTSEIGDREGGMELLSAGVMKEAREQNWMMVVVVRRERIDWTWNH